MQFLVLLEFDDNRKNSRLAEALDSKIGRKYTVKRDKDKAIITEELFDVLQAEIERADVDYISLIVKNNKGKTSFKVKDAELWSEEYDEILRTLRFNRKI